MKQIKFITVLLLFATMVFNITACSSDNEDGTKEDNSIIGKWKVMGEGHTDTYEIIEYKSNGTFEYFYTKDSYSEIGKYKIESDKLYLIWDEDDVQDWDIYKIHELNSISLIIEGYDIKGNLKGYNENFQRIK